MTDEIAHPPFEILLVEDSKVSAQVAMDALKKHAGFPHRLNWLSDGHEALSFLCQEGQYITVRRPDLLLLDLQLPGLDGRELLAMVRSNEQLKSLPVIVMTDKGGQAQLGDLTVEAFLTKPIEVAKFIEHVKAILKQGV